MLCDTDLSNQDKSGTQLYSSMAWSDTYVVDDRGDRHERTIGFFLNADGEKRINLDVPYGQSIRYILVFNNVPAEVLENLASRRNRRARRRKRSSHRLEGRPSRRWRKRSATNSFVLSRQS